MMNAGANSEGRRWQQGTFAQGFPNNQEASAFPSNESNGQHTTVGSLCLPPGAISDLHTAVRAQSHSGWVVKTVPIRSSSSSAARVRALLQTSGRWCATQLIRTTATSWLVCLAVQRPHRRLKLEVLVFGAARQSHTFQDIGSYHITHLRQFHSVGHAMKLNHSSGSTLRMA
ncbi:hypothetical protein MRB53_041268 [Persea americana]|nr:hypothetical protein MRB53_041268 [Persea americana]